MTTLSREDILKDTFNYILNTRENFNKIIEADSHDFEVVLKALKECNLYITECLIIERYIKEQGVTIQNRNLLSQVSSTRQALQMFNSSLTAILRSVTLLQRYKNDTGQLLEIDKNKFGILYKDETADCYLLFHLRSGWLQRFNFPYLTRSENQDLAYDMFNKMKYIENTN